MLGVSAAPGVHDRFFLKVNLPTHWGACWIWARPLDHSGYGRFWFDKKLRLAHRIAYALAFGGVPDHLELDHLCRRRSCGNPLRLEPVTEKENVRRGNSIAGISSRSATCWAGHLYDEANTRLRNNVRYCRRCDAQRQLACRARQRQRIGASS